MVNIIKTAARPWLSVDHAAQTNEDERKRITAGGGILRQHGGKDGVGGAWRVGETGLAVTRALGDADVKDDGVTADPEAGPVRV